MTMGLLWALCDAISAAITAAHSAWTVEVVADPQKELGDLKAGDDIEIMIGPISSEEENVEGSRRGIAGSMTVAMRLRSRVQDLSNTAAARAKCVAWDQAVEILQRREGFLAGAFGQVYWTGGTGAIDIGALRSDKVVSICSTDISFSSLHLKPKAT